jgi:hypothetical protein
MEKKKKKKGEEKILNDDDYNDYDYDDAREGEDDELICILFYTYIFFLFL